MTSNFEPDNTREKGQGETPERARSHPPVDTWIDYFTGRVPEHEASDLSRHLSHCRRCIDLILDLDAFADPSPPSTDVVSDFEKAAVWRTVKNAVEPSQTKAPGARLDRELAGRALAGNASDATRVRYWPAATAVAASLCIAALGLSVWNERHARVELESQLVELSLLQPNMVIEDLRPGARQRSFSGADTTVELPVNGGTIALILNLEDVVVFPSYEIRVVDSSGVEVTRVPGLEISEAGNFSLAVPPGALHAGSYQLRLFGLADGSGELIESYPIRFR